MANLTETEALAQCIVVGLGENGNAWGKEQASNAAMHLLKLRDSKRIGEAEFKGAYGRLGNHSAMRQQLEKGGVLKVDADDLTRAVKALQALDSKSRADALAKL